MYLYKHDQENQIVYRYPAEPSVQERKDRNSDWTIRMEYDITRADNQLTRGTWKHPTSAYPCQNLGSHYSKELAVSYFMRNHAPRGSDISREEYEKLHAKYEAAAHAG